MRGLSSRLRRTPGNTETVQPGSTGDASLYPPSDFGGEQPRAQARFSLHDVHVTYHVGATTVHALDGVTHSFAPATSTAITGRSGSGKSTLIAVLSLLRRPTSGQVLLNGTEAASMDERALSQARGRHIGVVFQSFHLDFTADAADNVALPWVYSRRPPRHRRQARAHATALLDHLGIGDLAARRPAHMSGGQRQRVAIARALFNNPTLLIADEPTGNLDEATAAEVAQELYALPADLGTTVVVVTHDDTIAEGADHRLHLAHGAFADRSPHEREPDGTS